MRRKKVETELQNSGWVSADKMGGSTGPQPDLQFQPPPGQNFANATGPGQAGMRPPGPAGPGAPQPQMSQIFIDDWFSLEPVGRIHLTMSFSMLYPHGPLLHTLIIHSETHKKQTAIRCWTWAQGCHSPAQRRSRGAVWSQVCSATVLQHYALRTLRRIPEICCGDAVLRLQVHLPQEVLPESCHQMYHAVECRNGSRRGKTQSPHSTSFYDFLQHGGELVLSLWIHTATRTETNAKMLW